MIPFSSSIDEEKGITKLSPGTKRAMLMVRIQECSFQTDH